MLVRLLQKACVLEVGRAGVSLLCAWSSAGKARGASEGSAGCMSEGEASGVEEQGGTHKVLIIEEGANE
eukprot:1161208-Pelagomonas_calceolata.AAC.3